MYFRICIKNLYFTFFCKLTFAKKSTSLDLQKSTFFCELQSKDHVSLASCLLTPLSPPPLKGDVNYGQPLGRSPFTISYGVAATNATQVQEVPCIGRSIGSSKSSYVGGSMGNLRRGVWGGIRTEGSVGRSRGGSIVSKHPPHPHDCIIMNF